MYNKDFDTEIVKYSFINFSRMSQVGGMHLACPCLDQPVLIYLIFDSTSLSKLSINGAKHLKLPPPPTEILLCTWMPHSLPIQSNAPFTWMFHSLESPFQQTHSVKWLIQLMDPFTWMTHFLEWPIHLEAPFSRPIHLINPFTWSTHSLEWPICLNDPFGWKPL